MPKPGRARSPNSATVTRGTSWEGHQKKTRELWRSKKEITWDTVTINNQQPTILLSYYITINNQQPTNHLMILWYTAMRIFFGDIIPISSDMWSTILSILCSRFCLNIRSITKKLPTLTRDNRGNMGKLYETMIDNSVNWCQILRHAQCSWICPGGVAPAVTKHHVANLPDRASLGKGEKLHVFQTPVVA